jgi:hypothetical protein
LEKEFGVKSSDDNGLQGQDSGLMLKLKKEI